MNNLQFFNNIRSLTDLLLSKIFLVIVLVFSFALYLSCIKQYENFESTTDYYLTEIDSMNLVEYENSLRNGEKISPISIYLKNKKEEESFKIEIEELETYSRTSVKILRNSGLKNIDHVVHLKTDYNACCSSHHSTYLLKTKKGKFIELPETDYVHCDGPTPISEYRFPNQKFGVDNKIILVKSYRNEKFKVDSVEIKKTFSWNGEIYNMEESNLEKTIWACDGYEGFEGDSLTFKTKNKVGYYIGGEYGFEFDSGYKITNDTLTIQTATAAFEVDDVSKLKPDLIQKYLVTKDSLILFYLANKVNNKWDKANINRIKQIPNYYKLR